MRKLQAGVANISRLLSLQTHAQDDVRAKVVTHVNVSKLCPEDSATNALMHIKEEGS